MKHSTVDYVFKHPYACLFHYHCLVMDEFERRGYNVAPDWNHRSYRGKVLGHDYESHFVWDYVGWDYPEHNDAYMQECIENLAGKGIAINVSI